MRVTVTSKKLEGDIQIPASKSYAHRYLIASALSEKLTKILGRLVGCDTMSTINCLVNMGAKIKRNNDNEIIVEPINYDELIIEPNKKISDSIINLNANESGSTLRFLLPVVSALGLSGRFSGEGKLVDRPIDDLIEQLNAHGIKISSKKLPLNTSGQLIGGQFNISGNVSSQYITGLLMALPLLNEDSTINIIGNLVSSNYIDMTLKVLNEFGIVIKKQNNKFKIKGNQKYKSPDIINIESDWSSACFFAVGGALNGNININGLNKKSLQGDKIVFDLLKKAGANINYKNGSLCIQKSNLKCIEFTATDYPDIVPIMAVALSCANGISKIYNVDRLKLKECDRLKAVIEMLDNLGIRSECNNNTLIIYGGTIKGGKINSYNDHRMVMSSAIAGLIAENEIIIEKAESINKSYPHFFEDYESLGGSVNAEI